MTDSQFKRRSRIYRVAIGTGFVLLAYITICVGMMFLETMMIYPAPRYPAGDWNTERVGAREITFHSADGTPLVGWFLRRDNARNVIVYFHGNGENVAYVADYIEEYQSALDASVLLFDYRGYGKSEGRPDETGVLADSLAAVQWVCEETGKRPEDIILIGRSLGGACAVHIAAQQNAKAVVLHSTFSSMVDVAAAHYPWLPIRWLMKNRYHLQEKIALYHGPLFQTHGEDDFVVPLRFGRQLFESSESKNKQFFAIKAGGHNDLEPRECWQALGEFIGALD